MKKAHILPLQCRDDRRLGVAEFEHGHQEVSAELEELSLTLIRDFAPALTVPRAQEYVVQGVCRRLITIRRCIDNIFIIFPPDRTKLLSEEERSDLHINLHAFTINISGLPDNLAWAYVLEKRITHENDFRVGLFNEYTKKHLPVELCTYLNSDDIRKWQEDYAKNYRDALIESHPSRPVQPFHFFKVGREFQL